MVYPLTQPSQAQREHEGGDVNEHENRKRRRSSSPLIPQNVLESPTKRTRLSPDSVSEDETSSLNGNGERGEDGAMGTSLPTSEVEQDPVQEKEGGEDDEERDGGRADDLDTQDSTPPGLGLAHESDKGKGKEKEANEFGLVGGQGPTVHAPKPLPLHAPKPTRPATSHHQPARHSADDQSNPDFEEPTHTPPPRPPTRVLGAATFDATAPLGATLTPSRDRDRLPHTNQLLASSRRSRPRPRPPSRHGNRTPVPSNSNQSGKIKEGGDGDELPRADAELDRPKTPERSQSAIFSSPASGSTASTVSPNIHRAGNIFAGGQGSPLAMRERGRMLASGGIDVSPPRLGSGVLPGVRPGVTGSGLLRDVLPASDFTNLTGVFEPQMVSTQQRRDDNIFPKRRAFAGMEESQSLPQSQEQSQGYALSQSPGYGGGGGLGFGGMGYSSQFDVEGGVEQVSGILERDVDFEAWLRDSTPPVEEEEENRRKDQTEGEEEEREVEEQVDMELA